jgi:hypothetical protein
LSSAINTRIEPVIASNGLVKVVRIDEAIRA